METQDKVFKIKSYGFAELAQLYSPHQSKQCAAAKLRNWIRISNFLKRELSEADYKPKQRVLTPKQVEILIRFLGEP